MDITSRWERFVKLDRAQSCLVATLALTLLAWISGPVVWGLLSKLASPEAAAWMAAVVVAAAIWPAVRAVLRCLFRPEMGAILYALAVGALGMWLDWLPWFIQGCLICLCMIPVGRLGLWPLMKGKPEAGYEKPAPEQLRRYPLIRGLMRAVMAGRSEPDGKLPRTRINRIALTGPWGCGKTLVLDHVAYALEQQKKARAVKVSPWGCTTVAEARAALADGMRTLLDDAPLQEVPFLKVIAKAFGASDTVDAVFTQVTGDRSASLKDLDRRLGKVEGQTGRRMILVIDDMERAEPEVVRALLPLLSELIELRYCTFLIAIDEEHFRGAFASNVRPKQEIEAKPEGATGDDNGRASSQRVTADGFLQKIFDLRIEMPPTAPHDRIAAMARLKLGLGTPEDSLEQPHLLSEKAPVAHDYPKLAAALPILSPHLPSNPRELERFLDKARLYEVCFLADYADEASSMFDREGDWPLFFHLWLMDTRFPGFAAAFARVRASAGLLADRGRELDDVVRDLREIAFHWATETEFKIALKGFLGSHDFMFANMTWYASGFLCPPSLSALKREKLNETWYQRCPIGLDALIQAAFDGTEAPDMIGLTRDLLKWLVNGASEALKKVARLSADTPDRIATEKDVAEHLEKVTSSMDLWSSSPRDRRILAQSIESDFIREWVSLSDLISYGNFAAELLDVVRSITFRILECSDVACLWKLLSDYRDWGLGSREDVTIALVKDINVTCRERIRAHVWNAVNANSTPTFWPFGAPHAGDALFEPGTYFPDGSEERGALEKALVSPSGSLLAGVEYVWYRLEEWLPRWQPDNGRVDLSSHADYWLMLWRAFEKHARYGTSKVREIIRTVPSIPAGLEKVREACSAETT